MSHLTDLADKQTLQLERQAAKIDDMHSVLMQAKGAKYVLIGTAAVAGTLASFAAKYLPFWGR